MRITRAGVLAGIMALTVAAVCARLGFWQLERLEQRQELNLSLAEAMARPPIHLDSAGFGAVAANPDAFLDRRATVEGSAVRGGDLLLRGRSHNGRPGVHLVSILRVPEAGRAILVNRGWLPSPDAATADPRPVSLHGDHHFEGFLRQVPTSGSEALPLAIELPDTTIQSFRRLDYPTIAAQLDLPLLPLYLEASSSSSSGGPPIPVPPPTLGEGPHLGYAVQWFSFAAIAILGYVALVAVRLRK
jgi:surfeit locus 1 family protein